MVKGDLPVEFGREQLLLRQTGVFAAPLRIIALNHRIYRLSRSGDRSTPGSAASRPDSNSRSGNSICRWVVYRKRVYHQNPKKYHLDLFSPDDGYVDYTAVTTDLWFTPQMLWHFSAGLAAQEKTLAGPRVNSPSTWFPLITTGPIAPGSSSRSLRTTCSGAFSCTRPWPPQTPLPQANLCLQDRGHEDAALPPHHRAARLTRISGREVLRFSQNAATEILFDQIPDRLVA
jgi:hypothetical protein